MAKDKKTTEGVSARKPGEKPGEGRLGKVEKQQKKEGKVPVGQLQRGIKPGDVDVQTGKPKSRFGRLKAFATRKERPERPPRTQGERLGQVSETAQRTFPKEEGTRPGGILNIEELRRETAGPMGKTQPPRTPPPGRELTLAQRKAKGMRVTAAHVPGSGEAPTKGEGIPEIERTGEGGLGKFRGRGYKPPPPKKQPPRKAKPKPKPKRKLKWWEKALKVTKELSAEAQRDAAKYEERKAGKKKDVKKAQRKLEKLPPKPKRKKKPKATQKPTRTGGPKRVEKFVTKPPPVPEDQAERAKGITERLMKQRTEQERKARERAEKRR